MYRPQSIGGPRIFRRCRTCPVSTLVRGPRQVGSSFGASVDDDGAMRWVNITNGPRYAKSGTITIDPITTTIATLIRRPLVWVISASDDFGAGIPQLPRPRLDTLAPAAQAQSRMLPANNSKAWRGGNNTPTLPVLPIAIVIRFHGRPSPTAVLCERSRSVQSKHSGIYRNAVRTLRCVDLR